MTKKEIIKLKERIDTHKEVLEKRFHYTTLVSNTIETLLEHGATEDKIEIFLYMMGELIKELQLVLEEIES
jgi:hypothetical protein